MVVEQPSGAYANDFESVPLTVHLQHNVSLTTKVVPFEQTFYLVTAEQVDVYAETGLLVQLSLSLFGLLAGAAITFLIAHSQAGITPVNNATFATGMWASGIAAAVALALARCFYCRQRKRRQEWFTT